MISSVIWGKTRDARVSSSKTLKIARVCLKDECYASVAFEKPTSECFFQISREIMLLLISKNLSLFYLFFIGFCLQ